MRDKYTKTLINKGSLLRKIGIIRQVRAICIALITIIALQPVYAAQIKGVVKDLETKEEIIGATIIVKEDTSKGVVSGLDGSFTLNHSIPCTLICRFIGYDNTEVSINSETEKGIVIYLKPASIQLEGAEVVATSSRGTEKSAILLQKNSMNVLEVISAKAIEISPDLNVANVLQRVPSVSLERTSGGQAQYAIIRGMDKRYSYTLVNGMKIPSPDNRFRYLPMDLFPSDLLDRLVVTKALTPDMEGDAIGGAMDMVMKDAPERFTINANASIGYSTMFFNSKFTTFDASVINYLSPRETNEELYQASKNDFTEGNATFREKSAFPNIVLGLSVGDRFLKKKQLGIMIAGSFQTIDFGNNSTFLTTTVRKENNEPFVSDVTERIYSTNDKRIGVHTKMDYKFSDNHKIDLYFLWVNLTRQEYRDALNISKELANRVEVWKRSRFNEQNVLNGTLFGDHNFINKQLNLNWAFAYSKAKQDFPDQVNLRLAQDEIGIVENPTLRWNFGSTRRWERNDDQDITGKINLSFNHDINKLNIKYTVGSMYRTKNRNNYYNEYTFDSSFGEQLYEGWSIAQLYVRNPLGIQQSPLNYSAYEDVLAFFGMITLEIGRWNILGGVRYEKTNMSWETDAPKFIYGKTGSRDYYDLLPSVSIKFEISPIQSVRASYFSSLSRPGFFEVIPYIIPGEEFSEAGNPFLKRVQADNIDLRWEMFPGGLDFFTVGVFFKSITNPIEYALMGSELKPENFGNATNWGIEFEATKYFHSFGIRANYSFTDSRITTTKEIWGRRDPSDPSSELVSSKIDQTRPLQGQSMHIGNLSLLYKSQKIGLDIQLAGVYTGRRIAMVSPYYEKDLWQKGTIQLDFSAEKRIYKKLSAYIKAGNLLNTPYILEMKGELTQTNIPLQDKKGVVTVRKDIFGSNVLLGFRFKL